MYKCVTPVTQLTIIEEDGEEYLQRHKRAVTYQYGMIQHKGRFPERQMPIVLDTLGNVENDMSNIITTWHRVCLNACSVLHICIYVCYLFSFYCFILLVCFAWGRRSWRIGILTPENM